MMTTTTSTTPTDPQVTQCIKILMVAIAAAAWAWDNMSWACWYDFYLLCLFYYTNFFLGSHTHIHTLNMLKWWWEWQQKPLVFFILFYFYNHFMHQNSYDRHWQQLLRWTKTEWRSGKIPKPWSRRLTMSGIVTDAASAYVLCPRSQSRWVR